MKHICSMAEFYKALALHDLICPEPLQSREAQLEDEPQPRHSPTTVGWPLAGAPSSARTGTALAGLGGHSQKPWSLGHSQGLERKEGPPACAGLTRLLCPHLCLQPKESFRSLGHSCALQGPGGGALLSVDRGTHARRGPRGNARRLCPSRTPLLPHNRPSALTPLGLGQPSVFPEPEPRWERARGPWIAPLVSASG